MGSFNYECDGQMSIFEFLPQEDDFCTMPEAEVMEIISQRIGVKLQYTNYSNKYDKLHDYSAKVGKMNINASIDTYVTTLGGDSKVIEGHKFISVGWGNSTSGGGRPCDSIDEAVEYLLKALGRKKERSTA